MNRSTDTNLHPSDVRYRTTHDGEGSLSVSVVQAIAEARDREPENLDRPLGQDLDMEALDRLFNGHTNTETRVMFSYDDDVVEVRSDGTILVCK